jgi:hypothetical protein
MRLLSIFGPREVRCQGQRELSKRIGPQYPPLAKSVPYTAPKTRTAAELITPRPSHCSISLPNYFSGTILVTSFRMLLMSASFSSPFLKA